MRRTKILLLSVAALTLLAAGACSKKKKDEGPQPAPAPARQSVLAGKDLPEPAVAFVAMANPAGTMAALEKLAALAGPVPPGMMQASLMSALLQAGLKDTSVIDLSRPAGLLVLDPKKFPQPVLLVVTTKGEKQVLESLQPAWKQAGRQGGAYHLVKEEKDTYAVFSGGAKDATVKHHLYLDFAGPLAFAGDAPGALEAGKALLQKLLPAAGSDLVASLQLDRLRTIFQAELGAAKQQFTQLLANDLQRPGLPPGSDAEKLTRFSVTMFEGLLSLFDQLQRVDLVGLCTESELELRLGLQAAAGSALARFLAEQKPGRLQLLPVLPQGGFLAMGLNVQWQSLKPKLAELTEEIMKIFFAREMPQQLLNTLMSMWDVLGDEIAFSENFDEHGLTVVEAFAVKDAQRAREVLLEVYKGIIEYINDTKVQGIGLHFQPPDKIGEHRGAELWSFDMTFDASAVDPAQTRVLRAMYGDKVHLVLAFHDRAVLLALGGQAEQMVRQALDRLAGQGQSFAEWPAFASAAGSRRGQDGGFMFLSVSGIIQAGMRNMQAMHGAGGEGLHQAPPASGVYLGGRTHQGALELALRLPAEHLKEIGAAVKAITNLKK